MMKREKPEHSTRETTITSQPLGRCTHCEANLRWRTSTSKRPYAFGDFGFPVHVAGLASATCARCRTQHVALRSPERFHAIVLEEVLKKPSALSAREVVFLRKHLHLTGAKFAALVGVSREHVSKTERGHSPNLGTAADRLARLMIAAKTDPSLRLLKRLLASLDESIGTRSRSKAVRHPGYHVALGSGRAVR